MCNGLQKSFGFTRQCIINCKLLRINCDLRFELVEHHLYLPELAPFGLPYVTKVKKEKFSS